MRHLRIYTKDVQSHGYSAHEYLASKISKGVGDTYDRDDHLEAQLKRTQESVGRLLETLRLHGIINDKEMLSVVGMRDWEVKREETIVKEEEFE